MPCLLKSSANWPCGSGTSSRRRRLSSSPSPATALPLPQDPEQRGLRPGHHFLGSSKVAQKQAWLHPSGQGGGKSSEVLGAGTWPLPTVSWASLVFPAVNVGVPSPAPTRVPRRVRSNEGGTQWSGLSVVLNNRTFEPVEAGVGRESPRPLCAPALLLRPGKAPLHWAYLCLRPGQLGARPPAGRAYALSLLCLLPLNPELRSLLFWLPKKPGLRMETSCIQTPACHQPPGSWLECYLPAPAQVLGRTQASETWMGP